MANTSRFSTVPSSGEGAMDPLTVEHPDSQMDHLTINAPPPTYSIATSSNFDSLVRATAPSGPSPKLAADMAEVGRQMGRGRHSRRRLVMKSGECNITRKNVMKRHRSYLKDIFTTLVDMKWRFHIALFTSGFVISWSLFAIVWYLIAYINGDLGDEHNDNRTMCVEGVHSFHTALLYSIETQHTIGYGTRAIHDVCWHATAVLMIQSCVGTFIQALITGIIFAKISRPKGRAQTILFSEKAVICKRDSEYFLLFRVGDMRRSHIIGTSIRAMLVKNRLTEEGESIPLCQYHLNLESETSRSDCFAFLVWPVTVVHKIDSSSPLWELSAAELYHDYFEIIVILEGTIESTGSLTQVRSSYIPAEIRWGERLAPLVTYQRHNGKYDIDYAQFHETIPMTNMLTCSAREHFETAMASAGMLVDGATDEKDFPFSFTAPAVRGGSAPLLHKHTLHGLFNKKPKQNQSQGQLPQQEPSEYVTIDGVTRRNPYLDTIQRQIGGNNSTGDSINSSATISNSMVVSRKPGLKRPLWLDKQFTKQLSALKREGSVRSSGRLYSSGRAREGYSSGDVANNKKNLDNSNREHASLIDNSTTSEEISDGVNVLSASTSGKIEGLSAADEFSDKIEVLKNTGITIKISSPQVDLHTIDETINDLNASNSNSNIATEVRNNNNSNKESSNNIGTVELNGKKKTSQFDDKEKNINPVSNSLSKSDSNINESAGTKPYQTTRRNSRFIVSTIPKFSSSAKIPESVSDADEAENSPSKESPKVPILVNLSDCTTDASNF